MGLDHLNAFDDADAVERARERAESMALDDFDVSNVYLFENDTHWPFSSACGVTHRCITAAIVTMARIGR